MTPERGYGPSDPLSLEMFLAYLSQAGWTFRDADARTTMWQRFTAGPERQDVRVVLPLRDDVTDKAELHQRALRAIAYAENRAVSDVEAEVRYGPADVMAIRLTPPSPAGQAPLTVARDAFDGLRTFVIGSVSGLSHPDYPVPPTFRPKADAFAGAVRVSTSPGSFVVTLSVPLSTTLEAAPDRMEEPEEINEGIEQEVDLLAPTSSREAAITDQVPLSPPFGRLVVTRMRRVVEHSVDLAAQVVAGQADVEVFQESPATTGNALELQALAEIAGPDGMPYVVRFAYSPTVAEELRDPQRISVAQDVVQVLRIASGQLRIPKPIVDVTVVGTVVGLVRERRSQVGEITVDGRFGDTIARKYRAHLLSNEYDLAVRAHRQGLEVSIRGDVVLRGHQYAIEPVRRIDFAGGLGDEG